MLYENYQNKMKKFAGFVGTLRRFRVPIIAVLALIAVVCAVLLSVRGVVYDVSACPQTVVYGSPLGYEAGAVFADVRYEYAAEGGEWSYEVPVRAGEYRVRAVSENIFGGKRYGKTHAFAIAPKETEVRVSQSSVEYGALPAVTADLAYGDTVQCTRFIYKDIAAKETEVSADESAIVALDKDGNDVTGCYIFRAVSAPIGFTPRKLCVRVQDASGIYDGAPLRFDGYELDASTSLAEGDMLVAQFDDERTEAGEGENVPEIRVKNSATGKDVTAQYDIEVVPGKLTVQKRPLVVTTLGASKIYDGAPLSESGYSIAAADEHSGLLAGHRAVFLSSALLTDAGSADNIMQFRIENEKGEDVSENYSLFFHAGELKVEKRKYIYSTGSAAWQYDGLPHTCAEYAVEEGEGDTGLLSGHTPALGELAAVTDAGTAENTTQLRIADAQGKDVTANYDAVCRAGTLTVTRRPLTVAAENGEWVFDGKAHSQPGHAVAESGLPLPAGHTTRAGQCAQITEAGSAPNTLVVLVFDADGMDVTANYDITYLAGTLTVHPRPITVTAASAEKVYDGTELKANGVVVTSEYDPALAAGHTYTAETAGSRTDAGTSVNEVIETEFAVRDAGGRDVSYNYAVTFAAGTLTVHPRPITVTASSAEKVYNATPLESDGVIITSEYAPALVAGHTYTAETAGSRTDAGTSVNEVVETEFSVRDAGGRDVTYNYAVTYQAGTLTVHRRPVTFKTAGNDWVYDGEEHFDTGFALSASNKYDPALVAGHRAEVWARTVVIDAGKSDNMLLIEIVAPSGLMMTRNYEISYEYGTLTVHPRPITVTAASAEKVYDGTPLESNEIAITSAYNPALIEGHYCDYYVKGAQTDAGQGACSVEYFRVYEEGGRDVTANYAPTFADGTLTVTRRPLTLTAESAEKIYDGTPLTANYRVLFGEPGLPLVDWHSLDFRIDSTITDAGTVSNVISSVKVLDSFRDVTANYDITCIDGTLTVEPLPIILRAGSAAKKFDGTFITCDTYEWIAKIEDRKLVDGHTAVVTTRGAQKDIGESDNTIASYAVYDGAREVTRNYDVECVNGSLRILFPDYTLKIRTGSAGKIYDGTELTSSVCEIVESDLPDTFKVNATATGSNWQVGRVNNTVHLEILTPDGTDISRLVYVEYDYGTLEVLPRPITLRTASNSWEYDGNSHSDAGAEFIAGGLADGDSLSVEKRTFVREVGTEENVVEYRILSSARDNFNVTFCYDITYVYGTLEITPSDYYDDIGIGLPPGVGGGGGEGGEGEFSPVGEIYSQNGGMVYLRRVNYGDYTGRGWRSTIPYDVLLDDTYSMNYLTSLALQNAGRQNGLIRIKMESGEYVLPYYMAPGEGGYLIQTSDVLYSGDASEPYELYYYFYNYAEKGFAGAVPDSYAAAESVYRDFVRREYIKVPDSAQSYLNYVIKEQGFSASDADIIAKVAKYVQGAAKYNLDYDRLLDVQTDIAVAFLRDFKEGICQHYASAATLLFRMLGIPARYTVGYAVEAEAGEWTEVTSENAHAWVEVYIDGMGWVYVEVTGSGPVFGGGGGQGGGDGELLPPSMELKPVDEVKQYDGTPLTPSAVEGANPHDALLLREWLNAGYTYEAEFDGSRTDVGWNYSSIRSFVLYDENGKEVTGIDFEFTNGRLTVVEETVITVRPYVLQKQYDGTPLMYGANDYTVTGLPDGYRLVLSLEGVGLTDAGVLDTSALEECFAAVYNEFGFDVTDAFYIHFDVTNALMVSRRAITVASISETKLYDGAPLTNGKYWIAGGSLADGETISVAVTGSQTDVGSSANTIGAVSVTDARGQDATANYKIVRAAGTLTVL